MKCQYCSQEMEEGAIKCPNCNSWIPEINKMQKKYYTWLGITIFTSLLVGWRMVALKGVGPLFKDPLGILLLLISGVVIAIAQVHYSKLNKRKKQS